MKPTIHPTWYQDAKVTCACGASFTVGSTLPEIHVEVCANCHPFYTGKSKYIDTMGRVEKFQLKQRGAKLSKTKKSKLDQIEEPPKTLKELVAEVKSQSE